MNAGAIAERCRQLGLDAHALARQASVDPFFLIDRLGHRGAAGLPIGLLKFLSRALGLGIDEMLASPAYDHDHLGDDVRVEAVLGVAGSLSRDDVAHVFGWKLDRAERALAGLEARLRPTGTRLLHAGPNAYRLGPALSVLSRHDQQRARRRESYRAKLEPDDAAVLRSITRGWVDKRHWDDPTVRVIVDRLTDAGLISDAGDHFSVPAEVAFSLRLHEPTH